MLVFHHDVAVILIPSTVHCALDLARDNICPLLLVPGAILIICLATKYAATARLCSTACVILFSCLQPRSGIVHLSQMLQLTRSPGMPPHLLLTPPTPPPPPPPHLQPLGIACNLPWKLQRSMKVDRNEPRKIQARISGSSVFQKRQQCLNTFLSVSAVDSL